MKARNKYETSIYKLRDKLPMITKTQRNWAEKNLFDKYVAIRYKTHVCVECNHRWKEAQDWHTEMLKEIDCPSCGSHLKLYDFKGQEWVSRLMGILTTYKGYQVFRLMEMSKHFSAMKKPHYSWSEVCQYWIRPDGKITSLQKRRNRSWSGADWMFGTDLEVRNAVNYTYQDSARIIPDKMYPRAKMIPEVARTGFNNDHCDWAAPNLMIHAILTNSHAETLIKNNQAKVCSDIAYGHEDRVDKHWNFVKLAMKHNYIITTSDWYDYIGMLIEFRKDPYNPALLFPSDLKAEHDKYVEKRRNKRRRLERRNRIQKLKEHEKMYKELKQRFFKLCIKEDDLVIRPLKSVREFQKEADELRHCVYSESYYLNKHNLVLSAKIKGKRTETIEFSLKNYMIVQSRGFRNFPTEHNERIRQLIQKNVKQIQKLSA